MFARFLTRKRVFGIKAWDELQDLVDSSFESTLMVGFFSHAQSGQDGDGGIVQPEEQGGVELRRLLCFSIGEQRTDERASTRAQAEKQIGTQTHTHT